MKFSNIKWLLPILGIVLYSCKKIININLNDASPQIVIEGNVTNMAGPYQVQITKTVNFSASNVFPPVSGAVVKITDNTSGTTDSLIETSPGIYTTNSTLGMYGHTYQLYISVQGQTYTASSTMPQLVVLDSLTFQHSDLFGTKNINPVVNFQDPAGIANYYTYRIYINSKPLKDTYTFSDRLSDGKYISQQIYLDSTYVSIGDSVLLQMNCVDKNVWSYFNTLSQATGSDQSVSPSNPISNISNNALGYFSATAISSKKSIAK